MGIIEVILLILTGSFVAQIIKRWFGTPLVVNQMIVGILLGPVGLGLLRSDLFVHQISEFGVIFLMFIAGLESNLRLLKKYLEPSLVVASLGVTLPMIGFPILGLIMGFSWFRALFLGVTFAATSVSISVAVLNEMNRLDSREGSVILGAAVADDIISVLLLGGINSLFRLNGHGNVWLSALFQIIFLFFSVGLIKWLPVWFRMVPNRYFLTLVMLVCLGETSLAQRVGLSLVTGAFLAGVAVGQINRFQSKTLACFKALGNLFFVPVFFIGIGLEMTLNGILSNLPLLIILIVLAVLTKFFGAGFGALLCKLNLKSAMLIGSGMVSRGEVALIIVQLGYHQAIFSSGWYSVIVAAIIITTILSPLLLKRISPKEKA